MSRPLDGLIHDLGADLRPVRRLHSPLVRAAGWLAALAVLALGMACFAKLPSVAHRLQMAPDMWFAVLGSASTAILATVAAFELSMPDRGRGWALLPLPGVVLWIAATGLGCLRGWSIPGVHVAAMRETGDCFIFIVGLSIPLSVGMVLMIRRAYTFHPQLTAAVGGLAVAAGAATLLNFFHPYDAGATDMLVHAVAVGLVVALNRTMGGRLLNPGTTPPRS